MFTPQTTPNLLNSLNGSSDVRSGTQTSLASQVILKAQTILMKPHPFPLCIKLSDSNEHINSELITSFISPGELLSFYQPVSRHGTLKFDLDLRLVLWNLAIDQSGN